MKNSKKMVICIVIAMIALSSIGSIAMTMIGPRGPMTISIAYSEKVNYETIMVANERGMFEDEGLNASVKLVTGGIQAAEALISGSVDLAAMGDAPAVQLITKGTGAKIVARFEGGAGIHRFIAWSDIVSPNDLEGRRLGLQQSSSTHGALLQWLDMNDVDVETIEFVYLSPLDIPAAMQTRQIDAMAGSEPWAVNTENLCGEGVHEIGNSSGLGSSFPIVLMASQKAISERPEAIRATILALDRANAFILQNWDMAMAICSDRTGLDLDDQSRCSACQFYEVGFNDTDAISIGMTAQSLLDFGKIATMPTIEDDVDLSFLPR